MPRPSDARARLIEAAARLLWSQGFHATGLNQILQESGAPKGSLYFHFPGGKEQLCVEALRVSGQRMTDAIQKTFTSGAEPASAIRDFTARLARHLERSDFRQGCPAATVALEAANESEALRQVCEGLFEEWRSLIAGKLEASGRTPEDAAAAATLVLSAIEGGLILSRAKRSVEPLRSLSDQIANVL